MRRLFKFVAGLILLLVVAAVAAFFLIDWIAKKGVEKGGAYALGVETHVKDMDVGLFAGKCSLDNLQIANPPGFRSADFLDLKRGELAVDVKSIFTETVLMPVMHMEGVALALERAGTRSNYSVILENLRKLQSGEAPKESEGTKIGPDILRHPEGAAEDALRRGKNLIPLPKPESPPKDEKRF